MATRTLTCLQADIVEGMLLVAFRMAHIFWVVLHDSFKHSAGRHLHLSNASSFLPFGYIKSQNGCAVFPSTSPGGGNAMYKICAYKRKLHAVFWQRQFLHL